jgi:drug/metabolite transporter (DMT)-like permease
MQLGVWTAVAMMAFAANSVLTRMAIAPGWIDAGSFAFIRLCAGAIVLLALVLGRRAVLGGGRPDLRPRATAVAGLLLYLYGFSWAYGGLEAGTGALILFGMVQITMFFGAILAREAIPPARWAGAALAFAGLLVLLVPDARGPSFGGVMVWAALSMAVAGFGWGLYSLAGRSVSDPLAATAAQFCWALPIGALVSWFLSGGSLPAATGQGVALAVFSGAVTSGLGYALWYGLVPRLGAARAAVAQLTVPVLTAFAGLWLLSEPFSLRFGLACLCVLGGVAVASLVRPNSRPQKVSPKAIRRVSAKPRSDLK